jgi:RNA polymerase sigma-70 factor (ECF subfamily)
LDLIKHEKIKQQHARSGISRPTGVLTLWRHGYGIRVGRRLQAMNKLPQCRVVFKLSRFEELKYSEIATQLDISIKTVENQMGKALRIMREELKDYIPLLIVLLNGIAN